MFSIRFKWLKHFICLESDARRLIVKSFHTRVNTLKILRAFYKSLFFTCKLPSRKSSEREHQMLNARERDLLTAVKWRRLPGWVISLRSSFASSKFIIKRVGGEWCVRKRRFLLSFWGKLGGNIERRQEIHLMNSESQKNRSAKINWNIFSPSRYKS